MPLLPRFLTGPLARLFPRPSAAAPQRGKQKPLVTEAEGPFAQATLTKWTLAFLAFGVVLRVTRYLLDFPLWGDETMLAVNFLDRGYLELTSPLDCLQISPILFSWIELSISRVLGFSAAALRLFPFACGLASLVLFWRLTARFCRGAAAPLAVAIFAVSYYLVRHPAEIKPYSSDLFSALLLIWLAARIEDRPTAARWTALVLVTPLVVLLSYPIAFVAGGVSLWLFAITPRRGDRSFWLPWVLFNAALVGTFVANYLVIAAAHYVRTYTQGVGAMWVEGWPPVTQPWELLVWTVREHTGRMFAYPAGGKNGASAATFLLFAAGVWQLLRVRERRSELVLLLVPFALAFVAAALQRYPYGGSARTMLFVAPAICLLAGIGGGWLLERITDTQRRQRTFVCALVALGIVGGASFLRDLTHPFKTEEDARLQDFAEWFWTDYGRGSELVCAGEDLGQSFHGENWHEASHDYLCWQRMFSARHRAGLPPDWEAISAEHPLKVVLYHVTQTPAEPARLNAWLAEMEERYTLQGHEVLQVNPHADIVYARQYEVYTFVPRPVERQAVIEQPLYLDSNGRPIEDARNGTWRKVPW